MEKNQTITFSEIGNKQHTFTDEYNHRYHFNSIVNEDSVLLALTFKEETSLKCLYAYNLMALEDMIFLDKERYYINLPHEKGLEIVPHLYV